MPTPHLPALLAVARGDTPADLVLRDARIINVFSGEIERGDVAVVGDAIAGVGGRYDGRETVDLAGAYLAPGLIDAHVHIESSLCTPPQFAAGVLPRGVTTVVADPHEIANVAGVAGIRYMAEASRNLPLNVVLMAPSCVPATHMETSGAALDAFDLAPLLADGTVHGLAEVMNFPGVIHGDEEVLHKLATFAHTPRDGHAPQLRGRMLNAYAASGIGSEHECTTVDEAREKLARGLYIFIREATNARNLHALLPLITPWNSRRLCLCTDDRVPGDLLDQGSIDWMVRETIRFGIDPITALRLATLNPAEYFGLRRRGGIAPGRAADLLVLQNLDDFAVRDVYASGKLVASEGALTQSMSSVEMPTSRATIDKGLKINPAQLLFDVAALQAGNSARVRVIGSLPDQLVTESRVLDLPVCDGLVVADPTRDVLKMAVVDRYSGEQRTGLGFIQGIGLRRGALAGTVAHDHHNLVVIGADDASMHAAASRVIELGGGLVAANGNKILAELPLPVAGLMSDRPLADVRADYDALIVAAHELGSPLHDPLMAMSFMALEVIPSLKLTDHGLVDVEAFEVVELFV